jgi:type I restriction enzyme S subunit
MCRPQSVPLGTLSTRITKGTTPTTLGYSFQDEGVNYVKSESITEDGRIDPSKFAFIAPETHEALQRSILEEGDVLFSMAGVYLGKTAVVDESILPANTNQAVGIIRLDRTRAVPRFIHYALSEPECRALVRSGVAQSAQPNINLRDIGGLPIPFFTVDEQLAIVGILGILDDKIELNRRMNRTLEAIARAIFKSWFVDFDPVHAKAEGREPVGMDPETAALFPDSFEDSPLGKIPKGWEISSLEKLLALSRESVKPQEHLTEKFDHFSIPAYDAGSPALEPGEAIRSSKYLVSPSAVLISKINPHIPRVWLPHVSKNRRAICSTEFLVCVPRNGISREYVYCLLSSPTFLDEFAQMVTGTTGSHQRVRPTAFVAMDVVKPPSELLSAFTSFSHPLLMRCATQLTETTSLSSVRDLLLPRLLSGGLTIAEGGASG